MSCVQNRAVRACQAVNAMIHDAGADLEHIISVFASKLEQDGVAAGMLIKIFCDVVNLGAARALVPNNQIAVVFSVVSGDLREGQGFAHFSVLCGADALAAGATTLAAP